MSENRTYPDVTAVCCPDYAPENVRAALLSALEPIGGLDWVTDGMTVAIKANLVSAMKPETAATTHPTVLCELTKLLTERGAKVIIGDSPGGIYSAAYVGHVYSASGVRACEECGAVLNDDFSQKNVRFPDGKVLHDFTYTAYLDRADAIIDVCKLKSLHKLPFPVKLFQKVFRAF